MYEDGDITREEYVWRKEQNEREIAHWEARTTETERIALELTLCFEALDRIANEWANSDDGERQEMVRSLFTDILYDLDVQRIVDFRLKLWADQFLVLRAALYAEGQKGELEGNENRVTLTGLRAANRFKRAS